MLQAYICKAWVAHYALLGKKKKNLSKFNG